MSSAGLPTLNLDLRTRRVERACAWAAIALALLAPALVASNIGLPGALVLSALAVSAVAAGLRQAGWIGSRRLLGVTWQADGRWFLTDGSGSWEAQLSADSRLASQVLWLRWRLLPVGRQQKNRQPGGRVLLLCARDILPDDFRRLQVRLRMDRPASDRSEFARSAAQAQIHPVS